MSNLFEYLSAEVLFRIGGYLKGSRYFCIVVLNQSFVIQYCNQAFCALFGRYEDVVDTPLKNLLQPECYPLLKEDISNNEMPLQLQLMDQDKVAVSLACQITKLDSGYLLLCDHALLADNDILQKITDINNEMILLNRELQREKQALSEAQRQIRSLSGIIPICMHCKEIRDDQGYWNNLESFVTKHSDAQFSHGICPQCMKERFPEELDKQT